MWVGLVLSTFLELKGGPDDKLSPLHLNWTSYQIDHTKFVLMRCLSHFFLNHLLIVDEILDHLSLLKLDSDDRMSITKHISDFLHFWKSHEINSDELVVYFSSSHLKVIIIIGVIPFHLLPSIPFSLSWRRSIRTLISVTTKMSMKEYLV